MKKLLLILIFIFALASCKNNNSNEEKEELCNHQYEYILTDDYSKIECLCTNCDYKYEIDLNFSFSYNYGYLDLNRFISSKSLKKLYLNMYVDVINFINEKKDLEIKNEHFQISKIDFNKYNLTKEEAMAVWHIFILDNPEFYFLEKTVLASNDEIILLCNKMYACREQRDIVEAKIKELNNAVIKTDNQLLNLEKVYSYVIENMTYAYEEIDGKKVAKKDFDSYELSGALLNKEGVCEAYCKLFSYLLKINGIKSIMYVGEGLLLSGSYVRHSWTIAQINDSWYGFDLTWDDSNSNKDNYGLSYDNLAKRHIVNEVNSQTLQRGVDFIYQMPKMATENL